ncbi:hypothetical protein LXA43DRAFT_513758 [Ganoderma leucocontextum]|nr:hypothetical protein LXA43DRAFT_513758 [Ganoderma leucocontextum]
MDAPESRSSRPSTRVSIQFPSLKVNAPNLLRLFSDGRNQLRAETSHPKGRTCRRARLSRPNDVAIFHCPDPKIPRVPQECGPSGGSVLHETPPIDCPVCPSRIQPARLPAFEASHTHEHLPDFLYVLDSSISEAPDVYVREWPSLPRDINGGLDLYASLLGGTMPRIAHLRLDGAEPVRTDHHACSYRAKLSLRDSTSGLVRRCRVVAKVAFQRCVDQSILRREAWLSEAFPPVAEPVRSRGRNSLRLEVTPQRPITSVKLLGLYGPQGTHAEQAHRGCTPPWKCMQSPPVLLMEDQDITSRGRSLTRKELRASRPSTASSARCSKRNILTYMRGSPLRMRCSPVDHSFIVPGDHATMQ